MARLHGLFFLISLFVISGCTSGEKKIPVENPVVPDSALGWADEDTYIVKARAATLPLAIDRAEHQILKDIVNVRVMNESPYTDIEKISVEFAGPLKNGKVIKQGEIEGGLEILYRIQDRGLKKKFERK